MLLLTFLISFFSSTSAFLSSVSFLSLLHNTSTFSITFFNQTLDSASAHSNNLDKESAYKAVASSLSNRSLLIIPLYNESLSNLERVLNVHSSTTISQKSLHNTVALSLASIHKLPNHLTWLKIEFITGVISFSYHLT